MIPYEQGEIKFEISPGATRPPRPPEAGSGAAGRGDDDAISPPSQGYAASRWLTEDPCPPYLP